MKRCPTCKRAMRKPLTDAQKALAAERAARYRTRKAARGK